MSKKMDVLNTWSEKLSALGYEPAFYEEDGEVFEQLDCIIDGTNFSVCPDDEDDDALWFSIIFEPDIEIDQAEEEKIASLDYGVFEEILLADDNTVHFTLKTSLDVTTDLVYDLIETIMNPDGAIQYLKSISYVW